MKPQKWYYSPPYKGTAHNIVNEDAELIATFEMKEDAEMVVELHNHVINIMQKYHGHS